MQDDTSSLSTIAEPAEPTLIPASELLAEEGNPPPPPPDPAALAAAAAMAEMGKKGDEKTDKKINEEKRKHAKRQAWRKKQADVLIGIRKEAGVKIKKEAVVKAGHLAKRKKADAEVKAKQDKIHASVLKMHKMAVAKAAAATEHLIALKKADKAKLATISGKSTEKDTKVIAKVKAAIVAKQTTLAAKATLAIAKIAKARKAQDDGIHKQEAKNEVALMKKFAEKRAAEDKQAALLSVYQAKLKKRDDAYRSKMSALDVKHSQWMKKQDSKEAASKVAGLQRTKGAIERRMKGSPGFKKVHRLERRQERETRLLTRQVTRTNRRQVHKAEDVMEGMSRDSNTAMSQVLTMQLKALNAGAKDFQKENAPKANKLVAEAWDFAMNGEPTDKAEVEAVQVARGGKTDLTPHSDRLQTPKERSAEDALQGAWDGAYGDRSPQDDMSKTKDSVTPNAETTAFAEALGVGVDAQNAKRSELMQQDQLSQAWASALGENAALDEDQQQALVSQAVGFDLESNSPPPAEMDLMHSSPSNQLSLPGDDVEVALSAQQALHPTEETATWAPSLAAGSINAVQHVAQQRTQESAWQHAANPGQSADEAVARILAREEKLRKMDTHPTDPLLGDDRKKTVRPKTVEKTVRPKTVEKTVELKAVKPSKDHTVMIGKGSEDETLSEEDPVSSEEDPVSQSNTKPERFFVKHGNPFIEKELQEDAARIPEPYHSDAGQGKKPAVAVTAMAVAIALAYLVVV